MVFNLLFNTLVVSQIVSGGFPSPGAIIKKTALFQEQFSAVDPIFFWFMRVGWQ
jgi:hypothetical protein